MKPVTPIVPGWRLPVTNFAKGQDEYLTLPGWRSGGERESVLSRWRLTWRERLKILCTGNLYLWLATFGMPLQPVLPTVDKPTVKLGPGIYDEAPNKTK